MQDGNGRDMRMSPYKGARQEKAMEISRFYESFLV
jgi:hypothetical protein